MAHQALPTASDVTRSSEDTGSGIAPTKALVDDEAHPMWTDKDDKDLANAEEILAQLYRRLAGYLQASYIMRDGLKDDVSTRMEAFLEAAEQQLTEIETLPRRKKASAQGTALTEPRLRENFGTVSQQYENSSHRTSQLSPTEKPTTRRHMHSLPHTPREYVVVGKDCEGWAMGNARQLEEVEVNHHRLWCEYIKSWVRPFPNRWWLLPDDIIDEWNATLYACIQLRKLAEALREGLEPRAAEATATHSDRADSSDCAGSSDWTEADAQELEEVEAMASKLNREFVCFLVDAYIRDHGLTDDTKTTMFAFLDVLGPLCEQVEDLKSRWEHQRMQARRRERLQHERELAQQRKLERDKDFERERQRQLDAHNVFWRRASRWIGHHVPIGKKRKAPVLLDEASMKVEKASRR